MSIQWFPGHMTRARREIEGKLKLIDVVIELLDARIPLSSRNPMIDEILTSKPRVVVLNKADLADPILTEAWVSHFKKQGISALPLNSVAHRGAEELIQAAEDALTEQREREARRGIRPRAIRALIVGIPNVGKSTLINRLAGRQVAATGDRPGVTKGQQWIKVGRAMELLDTPGILWPKFEDPEVGRRLAATGAIKETIIDIEEVAFHALRYLIDRYAEPLMERFTLTSLPNDPDNPHELIEMMEEIGRKRGCLRSGGQVDLSKTAGIILREMRAGKLGRVTFETPSAT